MTLVTTHASLATVDDMFRYRADGFELPPFAGYTNDQWGIKAHNRPWIAATGQWKPGQRVIEVGGAYSRLPEWLGETFGVEPWIGDDFGESTDDIEMWSRWGDPRDLPNKHPSVHYEFENFAPGSSYKDSFFDCVFSVSTLEHVPAEYRLGVLKDIHRALAPGGSELHTIDVGVPSPRRTLLAAVAERTPLQRVLMSRYPSSIGAWWSIFRQSGVDMTHVKMPSSFELLERSTLVESPDVVYRFIPPRDAPSPYLPSASLLLVIEDL